MERLLDRNVHVSNREHNMDAALQSACYKPRTKMLQMLLDWCHDSLLRHKSLPGLGYGLIALVQGATSAQADLLRTEDLIQKIRNAKLDSTADTFCETYYYVISPNYHDREMACQRSLIDWGIERCWRDVLSANALGFVPTGGTDD